ncbi:MAG: hypothetical protein Q4C83_00950 [Candidatus Saccharibacteria bacterium]|nr:hypothetical protein [Candidatus Saccharibacteria bacterium]
MFIPTFSVSQVSSVRLSAAQAYPGNGTNFRYMGTPGSGGVVGGVRKTSVDNAGGGKSHNNLQPYQTIYLWLRIK